MADEKDGSGENRETNNSANIPLGTNPDGPQTPSLKYRPFRGYKAAGDEKAAGKSRRVTTANRSAKTSAPAVAPTDPLQSAEDNAALTQAQTLLDAGRAAANSILASDAAKEKKTRVALDAAMRLHEHLSSRSLVAKRLYEEQGIRLTKATKNEFLPIVKLVFGDAGRSNISRHAKVLRYVADNREDDESLSETVDRGDGLVACAKADTARYQGPARQRALETRHAYLTQLRANGVALSNIAVVANVGEKLTALLVERADDGTLKVIGVRPESELAAISRYNEIRR